MSRKSILSLNGDNLEKLPLEKSDEERGFCDKRGILSMPKGIRLYDYQEAAITNWAANNYRGIFDMATGTGKTLTGLGAAVRVFEDKKKTAIIIVCPYQHLAEQWAEETVKFNIIPTVGYSASKQQDWKKCLQKDIMDFKLGVIPTLCFVTTNATFSTEFVRTQLNKLGKDTLLIVDEAHNFGAKGLRLTLNPKFEYRLALSATLERYGDPEGTQVLKEYFGEKCIEYGIERAIREDKLTPYYYYPCAVYLTEDELEKYRDVSKRISKQCHTNDKGEFEITEFGKKLLIERSRLVAGARGKIPLLKKLMAERINESHMLVYCGAAKSYDLSGNKTETDEEGERQAVSVSKMLGNELGIKVTHFTSAESAEERERIKEQFADANPYQAIVAIKCLDEGVNIPSIKTVFILASSTNPKEYIQRRGRVLRKAPNKDFAVIYDFITLPTRTECVGESGESVNTDIGLVKREIKRMKVFGEISLNPSECDKMIKELVDAYGLDEINPKEGF